MSQVGEAHKMMWKQMEWARQSMALVEEWGKDWWPADSEARFNLETACLHLDNALRLAEQIDSGVVYDCHK